MPCFCNKLQGLSLTYVKIGAIIKPNTSVKITIFQFFVLVLLLLKSIWPIIIAIIIGIIAGILPNQYILGIIIILFIIIYKLKINSTIKVFKKSFSKLFSLYFLMPDIVNYKLVMISYIGSFIGIMILPTHLCFSLTKDYFKAEYKDIFKILIIILGIFLVFCIGLFVIGYPTI